MRFAYGINAIQGNDVTPSVQYWRGREGEVDFVFEVDGTPVPIGQRISHAGVRGHSKPFESSKSRTTCHLGSSSLATQFEADNPLKISVRELFNFHTGCTCSYALVTT